MSIYFWGALIAVFFIGVTLWMRKEQAAFRHLLREQIARRGGQVTAPTLFRYPELRFVVEKTQLIVSAMPNSGTTGHPGEFSYVDFVIDRPSAMSFQLQTRVRSAQRLFDGLGKQHQLQLDNLEFDKKFTLYSHNPDEVKRLFTHEVQTALLAAGQPLGVQFDGARFSLTNDKIVKTERECDEVIEIAILFLARLLAG